MKTRGLLAILIILLINICLTPVEAQQSALAGTIAGKHTGAVTALFQDGNEIYSAGRDGFLEIWDIRQARARERFQLSQLAILALDRHPARDEICLLESDGMGIYRVSAWNYKNREKLFSVRLSDPVGFVNYSGSGAFVIVGCTGRSGFVFIDSRTGELLEAPDALSASLAFAATGKSERSMVSYFSSGTLVYWGLASGERISGFTIPPNLSSPVIFGNNRFFAGVDSAGLAVINAATGELIGRHASIPADSLLAVASDELYCLVRQKPETSVYHFSVERTGLHEKKFLPVQLDDAALISAFSAGETIALGMADGTVITLDANGSSRPMSYNNQTLITAAAVSDSSIAFLTSDYELGFLPLDYTAFNAKYNPVREKHESYTRISPLLNQTNQTSESHDKFLLWQGRNTRVVPLVVSADSDTPPVRISDISLRQPLRTVQVFEQRLLLLDTAGNLAILPFGGGTGRRFSFSFVGAMDAAFINRDRVLLCRSAVSGNSPFVLINVATGETVPLAWPCEAGVMAYRGSSGDMYAITIEEDTADEQSGDQGGGQTGDQIGGGVKTVVIKLDTARPAQSQRLMEYLGEDIQSSLAEADARVAATIGGEGAFLYDADVNIRFERTPGLPVHLYGAGDRFILLDAEGSIAWYSAQSGSLLAVFRLYADEWTLQTRQNIIRGKREELSMNSEQ